MWLSVEFSTANTPVLQNCYIVRVNYSSRTYGCNVRVKYQCFQYRIPQVAPHVLSTYLHSLYFTANFRQAPPCMHLILLHWIFLEESCQYTNRNFQVHEFFHIRHGIELEPQITNTIHDACGQTKDQVLKWGLTRLLMNYKCNHQAPYKL
jgi:hypothetical protein